MSNNKIIAEAAFSLLQLLGFDCTHMENQHRVAFNSACFLKPNSKAFEVIIHFLLSQLDHELANKVFRNCWPAVLKEQQKEFRDNAFTWLTEISQKPKSIRIPHITKSVLLTPNGTKVYELIFGLAQYVLIVRLSQLNEKTKANIHIRPRLYISSANEKAKIMSKKQQFQCSALLKCLSQNLKRSYYELEILLKTLMAPRKEMKEYIEEKISHIRQGLERRQTLKSQIANMNAAIEKRFDEIKRKGDSSTETHKEYVDRAQKKMNDLWSNVKNCIVVSDRSYTVLEDILKSSAKSETMSIDGKSYSIEMPKFLLWEHGNAVMNYKIGDLFLQGELDLINITRLNHLQISMKGELLFKIEKKQIIELVNNILFSSERIHSKEMHERAINYKREMTQLIPQLATDINTTKMQLFKNLQASTRSNTARTLTPLKSFNFNSPAKLVSPLTPGKQSPASITAQSYFQKFKTPHIKLSPRKKLSHFNETIDNDDCDNVSDIDLLPAFNQMHSFFKNENNQSGSDLADWNKENDFSSIKFDLNLTENPLTSSRIHLNANKMASDENYFTSSNDTHAKFELSLNENEAKHDNTSLQIIDMSGYDDDDLI